MNKERRVGRRSVVHNLVKLTPENENEDKRGAKKALFEKNVDDDATFVMSRRPLNPLHEINNFLSSTKSKSHENIHTEDIYGTPASSNDNYINMYGHFNKIPLSPPNRTGFFEASMTKNLKNGELKNPILQSKELFSTLIDSPCTKYEKVQFNNALSSASKYLLNRHLESIEKNVDKFDSTSPDIVLPKSSQNLNSFKSEEFKTPYQVDLTITPEKNVFQPENKSLSSDIGLLIENIEKSKANQLKNIRESKIQCCNMLKNRFREIELEIEKHFGTIESDINEDYEKLINIINEKKIENESTVQNSVTTVKETDTKKKNYSRMTGAFGILNNLNTECSFLKTPKTKGKTREEMLSKGTLTPSTMSFVLQEQLLSLDNSL
ncbi:uncharacterized protein LOC126900273 [Daktulosphaira vitifoliae]|uniref:uncharacterized protein LOC126900273 n=1 Tax=Daktulosphaira vitifoliae TaxID=58002 RepID=UPI0021AAD54B|nr:uncharacterized protein LOC126900273 [Daktulosphaira vitifoliae]XP_050531829.1 uncharacterized protein LOC126900273 [Daktulosphaira vitifoliae]